MNDRQIEFLAEQRRSQIVEEMKQIRFAEQAGTRQQRGNWLKAGMYGLGSWMMALGQRLRHPYETSVRRSKVTRHGLAG